MNSLSDSVWSGVTLSSSPMHACGREVSLQRWTRLGRLWFGSSCVRSMRVAACRHLAPAAGAATKKTERRYENGVQTNSLMQSEGLARTDLFAKAQKRARNTIESTATSERAFATRRPCQPRPLELEMRRYLQPCKLVLRCAPRRALVTSRSQLRVSRIPFRSGGARTGTETLARTS